MEGLRVQGTEGILRHPPISVSVDQVFTPMIKSEEGKQIWLVKGMGIGIRSLQQSSSSFTLNLLYLKHRQTIARGLCLFSRSVRAKSVTDPATQRNKSNINYNVLSCALTHSRRLSSSEARKLTQISYNVWGYIATKLTKINYGQVFCIFFTPVSMQSKRRMGDSITLIVGRRTGYCNHA